jgi:hypothetical protein
MEVTTIVNKKQKKNFRNSKPKNAKGKNKKLKSSKKRFSKSNLVCSHPLGGTAPMESYLVAPDIFGPCRVPRPGGSSKTGIGMDRSLVSIIGSATNVVQAVNMSTIFATSCALTYTSTSTSAGLITGSVITPQNQFPVNTQIDDVSIVSACFTISYLGAPLNAAGELIIGTLSLDNNSLVGASYSGLYFYPGIMKVPIASLIDAPLRVFMTKSSPQADNFLSPTSTIPDCMRPFVATSGQTVAAQLNIEVTRCWEYHSITVSGSVVPYTVSGDSYVGDMLEYQQLANDLTILPNSVIEGSSEYLREAAFGVLGSYLTNSAPTMMTGLTGLATATFNHYRNSEGRNRIQL